MKVEDIAQRLTSTFQRVHDERMRGLPILNPSLRVQVVGACSFEGDWIGVLVTPWCMNLVLVPGPDSANRPGTVGVKQALRLPAGALEMIGSEEADIGPFGACSLYSPMGGFADQESAVETAERILAALLDPEPPSVEPGPSPRRPGVSRRSLLRGVFGAGYISGPR